MALPILAGFALRGIGNLISRRRALRGASFGRVMNTQPQGPATTPISQAATTSPGIKGNAAPGVVAGGAQAPIRPPGTGPKNAPGIVAGGAQIPDRGNMLTNETRGETIGTIDPGRGQVQTQEVLSGRDLGGGEADRLGRESIARSRRRNLQQATLSNQALR